MDRMTLPVQLFRNGIDQERHVLIDDLDHAVRTVPAAAGLAGVKDADRGLARCALLKLAPHGRNAASQKIGRNP